MLFNLYSKTGNLTHRGKKASAEQRYLIRILNQTKHSGISPIETFAREKIDTFFWVPNTEESVHTPACRIVELHSPVFTHVDRYHFAPQEKPLYQHPWKGRHEEEMKESSDGETHHLERNHTPFQEGESSGSFWARVVRRKTATCKLCCGMCSNVYKHSQAPGRVLKVATHD